MSEPRDHTQSNARDRIKADMIRRIELGDWRVGDRIPTLDVLCEHYAYSRMTVSQAARDLVAEGILETRGRAGTVVRRAPAAAAIGILANYATGGHDFAAYVHALTRRLSADLTAAGWPVRLYHETPDLLSVGGRPCSSLLAELDRHELAGLITVASNLPEWERRHPTQRLALPTVNVSYHPSRHRVYIDFAAATTTAVAMLADAGCTALGLIGAPHPEVSEAFARAVARHGVATDDLWRHAEPQTLVTEAQGFAALHAIWAQPRRPDAVFVPDDVAAKGVAQAAMALGIRVPDELRILYIANEGVDQFFPVRADRLVLSLSTISAEAVGLLASVIADAETPATDIRVAPAPAPVAQEIAHV
jgi:DNA-binding LacI/PurR family transcriptional regulator